MNTFRSILCWASAAILVALGGALLAFPEHGAQLTPPAAATTAPSIDPPTAAALPRSDPVILSIPALGLTTELDAIGLKPDGTVQDPASFHRPSWYRPGATPGERGSAVILGHVDSYRGPAIFFRLGQLQPGDTLEVTRADGDSARFAVTRVDTVTKDAFPAQAVYADHGRPELQLVTCGGDFDTNRRSYRANIIVYSTLIAN